MRVSYAILGLLGIFTSASCLLYRLTTLLPKSKSGYVVSFPSNLDQLKELESFLKSYKEEHFGYVLFLFCLAYLYKQTFAIPGSVFMNILAGALFGMLWSVIMTSTLTAVGATCCFLLSKIFGRTILMNYFPQKLSHLQDKVNENRDGLFFFLLCLRLFPMSPNWFLNMSSPLLGVPLLYFFPSVLIGLMPYNIICCQTGNILSEITSLSDMFTWSMILKLGVLAVVVGLPGVFARLYKRKKDV